MKIEKILYSSHFKKALKRLPRELKETIETMEKIFRKNCFDTRLKTHKLSGKLKNYWSFSITHSHRVLFQFLGKGRVGFIDIGDHSIYQ